VCTVTIVPQPDGFRLACNRDESRRRSPALPPVERRYADRRALLPIDPISDGTWIAVNDAGLVLTLLNVYEVKRDVGAEGERNEAGEGRTANHEQLSGGRQHDAPPKRLPTGPAPPVAPSPALSRGLIIPSLLHCSGASQAAACAAALDAKTYPAFRLVIVDCTGVAEARGDSRDVHVSARPLGRQPLLFTSSGLGDAVVEAPRRALFDEMFASSTDWPAVQDAFHRHQWPDRPHLSVCMSRPEACTVSHTVVEVQTGHCTMAYYGEPRDQAISSAIARL